MATIPIETVIELLLRNHRSLGSGDSADVCVYPIQGPPICAWLPVHLVPKLRDYLLTLVPQPKLLSECEEGAG